MYFVRQRRMVLMMETERTISFSYMNPPNCPIKADSSKCIQSEEMYESSKTLSGHIAYDDIGCICTLCWNEIMKGFSENKYIKSLYLEEANKNLNVEFKMISCILYPQYNSTFLENVTLKFETIESDSIKSLKEYLQNTQGLKHLEIITGKINKPQFLEQGFAANKSLKFFRFQLDKDTTNSDVKTLQSIINGVGLNQSLQKVVLLVENTIIGQLDFQTLLSKNKTLKQLNISFQRSRIDSGFAISTIAKNLMKNTSIEKFVLNLRAAEYKKDSLAYFQQGIQKNTSIKTFKIIIDGQGSKHFDKMMMGLASSKSIKKLNLNLSNLEIDESNINSIGNILHQNLVVEELTILQSLFGFYKAQNLLSNISMKSNLSVICVQGNWLPRLSQLSKFIESTNKLKKIALQFNMCDTGDLQQLAKSLQINKSVESFSICNNDTIIKEDFFEHWKSSDTLNHLDFLSQQFFIDLSSLQKDKKWFEFILNSKNIKNLDMFPSDIHKAIVRIKEEGRQFDKINTRCYLDLKQISRILEIQRKLVSLEYLNPFYNNTEVYNKNLQKYKYIIFKQVYDNNYLIKFGTSSLIEMGSPLQVHRELCLYRERQLLTVIALMKEVIPLIQYSPLFTMMDLYCD